MKSFSKGPAIGIEFFTSNGKLTGTRLFLSPTFTVIGSPLELWLEAYLNGIPFSLDLSAGTPHQQKVMLAMQRIPFGQTASYKELASLSGNPKGARAIGNACNRNPFPLLVPCHRIIGHDGSIGGFGYSLEIKRRLLAFEAEFPLPHQN